MALNVIRVYSYHGNVSTIFTCTESGCGSQETFICWVSMATTLTAIGASGAVKQKK